MFEAPLIGRAHRIVGANTTVIGNVSSTVTAQPNIYLIGIAVNATVTGATTVRVWAGTTATSTAAGTPLSGAIVFASGTATGLTRLHQYLPFPAYCSGGAVVQVAGDNTDVTLYWNPAGRSP